MHFSKKVLVFLLMNFFCFGQNEGDFRSVGGSLSNPNSWTTSDTWEQFQSGSWVNTAAVPLAENFSGHIIIQENTFVTYTVNNQSSQFDLDGGIIVNGNFRVSIPTNSNNLFFGEVNEFILNAGGVFRASFGNNPQFRIDIVELFKVNGGELRYESGNTNSALWIECKGVAEINGGLVINATNTGLNNSGLYMSGDGTPEAPQHLKISSNISEGARNRFFVTESTFVIEEYASSIQQNTVFGDVPEPRAGYDGFQNKTDNLNLVVNNSSAEGLNLSRNKTVNDTVFLKNGAFNFNANTFNLGNNAAIVRTGGEFSSAPNFGNSLDLIYDEHTSLIETSNEIPQDNSRLTKLTVNSSLDVALTQDLEFSGNLNLNQGKLLIDENQGLVFAGSIENTSGFLGGTGTFEIQSLNGIEDQLFDSNTFVGNLIVNNNVNFSLPDGFTTLGDFQLREGQIDLLENTIVFGGDLLRENGQMDARTAIVRMTSDGDQAIDNDFFQNNELFILENDGMGGPNLSNPLTITNILSPNSGEIKSNGHLILKSDESRTAQIDEAGAGASITGDVEVQRFIPAKRAFRFISPTVTTTTSIRDNWQEGAESYLDDPNPGFGTHITGNNTSETDNNQNNGLDWQPSGDPSLFEYDNIIQNWVAKANTTDVLEAGQPYRLIVRGDRSIDVTVNDAIPTSTTLREIGIVELSEPTFTNFDTEEDAFNFFGNPYQANVDIQQVFANSTNVKATHYYVWDPTLNENGVYVTVNLLDDGSNPVGSEANAILQPKQAAFFQTSNETTNVNLQFAQDQKAVSQPQTSVFSIEQNLYLNMRLYSSKNFAEGKTAYDGLRIYFDDAYLNATEDDFVKFPNVDENISRVNSNQLYAIEYRQMPFENEKLPLEISNYKTTEYVIEFDVEGDLSQEVFLHDRYQEELILIDRNNSTYPFEIESEIPESRDKDRFELVFGQETLSTDEFSQPRLQLYPNPSPDGSFSISGEDSEPITAIHIYDNLGRLLYSKTSDIENISTVQDFKPNSGIYYVQVKNSDQREEQTFKLIVE